MTAVTIPLPFRRRRPAAPVAVWLSTGLLGLFVLAAIVGPIVHPYHPVTVNIAARLLPPGSHIPGGGTAWLGTDQVGHDLLAEVLAGARVSLIVAAATILIGGTIGLFLGLLAGYFRGWADSVIMRIGDIQLAFPSLLLAILIAGVLGPSLLNVILTLAITRWVVFARVVRASVLVEAKKESVDGARVVGVPTFRILYKYILPQLVGPLLVLATVQVGQMVVAEASLSFLGLGVPITEASWGSTIANGQNYIDTAWWIATFPGIAMALLVVAVGVAADAYRRKSRLSIDT